MEKKERFTNAYNYLRGKGYFHTQKDVAEKMHSTQQNISAAIAGNEKVLTNNFIIRFCAAFGGVINAEWIISGEGNMTGDINGNNNTIGNANSVVFNESSTINKLIDEMAAMRIAHERETAQLLEIIKNLTSK